MDRTLDGFFPQIWFQLLRSESQQQHSSKPTKMLRQNPQTGTYHFKKSFGRRSNSYILNIASTGTGTFMDKSEHGLYQWGRCCGCRWYYSSELLPYLYAQEYYVICQNQGIFKKQLWAKSQPRKLFVQSKQLVLKMAGSGLARDQGADFRFVNWRENCYIHRRLRPSMVSHSIKLA